MLSINVAMKMPVADTVKTVHAEGVAVAEDDRSQKLILIGMTLAVEDVVAEVAVHRMSFALEEERIES